MEVLTKHRFETRRSDMEVFHKTIQVMISLSAGSLTLLVTFVKSYVTAGAMWQWLVPLSWLLLALSLVAAVLTLLGENFRHNTYWKSIDAISKEAGDLVDKLKSEGKPRNYEQESVSLENKIANIDDQPTKFFRCCAWAMILSLLGGIVSIALFAILNWKSLHS